MKNFDKNLERLQEISSEIKDPEIALEKASELFEEGIKLASGLEKQLDSLENKIEILINDSGADDQPEFALFTDSGDSE